MTIPSTRLSLIALCALSASVFLHAQDTSPATASSTHAADNTGINTRDSSHATTTSSSQSNDKADVQLAAAVRRALMKDTSLSTLGHNVKVMASNGTVTLRGPVKSDDEKSRIESTTRAVAGVQQVTNDLEVKP